MWETKSVPLEGDRRDTQDKQGLTIMGEHTKGTRKKTDLTPRRTQDSRSKDRQKTRHGFGETEAPEG